MIKRLFGIDKAKVVNTDKVVPAKRTRTGKRIASKGMEKGS